MTYTAEPLSPNLTGPPVVLKSRDVAIDYLRSTLTVMVVAHHSALAYTTFAHLDTAHYLRSTAPIVDEMRWIFLDYAENFNDVFFMSLMFFVSGLFVWPSLQRGGAAAFLKNRLLRLGAPFVVVALTLMPVAYYSSWEITGHEAGFTNYWRQNIVTDRITPGPLWFVWVLLLFDIIIAVVFLARPGRGMSLMSKETCLERRPLLAAAAMLLACGVVYFPALRVFGFGGWSIFLVRPFYFQTCRFGLYLLWFLAGVWIGRDGVDRGLLAPSGALARHWALWVLGCVIAYNLLVIVPRISIAAPLSTPQRGALEAILWVVSCVTSCFGFLALFRGVVSKPRPWIDNLTRCAYGIYLVHYLFVLWCQWLLLGQSLPAGGKFLITFIVALALSWTSARIMLLSPVTRKVL
ncbi:acyltransferase [Rhizobium sp. P38BS-XIX]|uniref:acyltransferase family protein n=1 Tax=Rhizobium sp. P38BS-XIX TaxID=2726740 RepID=UPI0014569CBA|nr:acyltransferase [Rhizobium sp. P38BS-XIX]NLR97500.1 acyltransferase [Rhizobium sp. P38BS-XIX]